MIEQHTRVYFFRSSFDKYDGCVDKVLNKIVLSKASKQAKWIDNSIKKLLPKWVVKNAKKYQNNRMFRFLVKNIYKIEISMIAGLRGKKEIEIKKGGEVKYRGIFYD
jgi:hypothetical protein